MWPRRRWPVRCALVWSSLERTRTVSAPDARIWTVRRVLVPRGPEWKAGRRAARSRTAAADPPSDTDLAARFELPVDAAVELAPMVTVVVIAVAILFVVLAPLLAFLLDVIVVLAGAALAIAGRVFFRRPWRIEASTETTPPEQIAWGVVGTRASGAAVDVIARDIARGVPVTDLRPGIPLTP